MAAANTQDGEERWRLLDRDATLTLFTAASDETDAYGSLTFSCTKASGTIEVGVDMGETERSAFADMISRDQYPNVVLVPPDPKFGSLPELGFSELGGWYYRFSISSEAKAFRDFTKTGAFKFKIGNAEVANSFNVGLENAVKFQNGCREAKTR